MNLKICLSLVLLSTMAQAQSDVVNSDSAKKQEPNYCMDKYHEILRFRDPLMYLAYPYIQGIGDRRVPLREGEGKNGFLGEGQLAYRFVIFQGKYYSYPFLQRLRFTFDAGMLFRLANDYSAPMLPPNASLGLGADYLISNLDLLKKEKAVFVWTTVQLHHYSNGQADSFFIDGPVQRNNYRSGNFSTNYASVLVNVAFNSAHDNTITASLGYQNEVDLGGPIAMSTQLEGDYGLRRLLFGVQWVRKPMLSYVKVKNQGTDEAGDEVTIRRRRQIMVRTEMDYILDDVSKFTGNSPQRWGAHAYLTYMPSVANEVGLIAHGYYGRDYLNIRFDDIVLIAEIGVCVKFTGGGGGMIRD